MEPGGVYRLSSLPSSSYRIGLMDAPGTSDTRRAVTWTGVTSGDVIAVLCVGPPRRDISFTYHNMLIATREGIGWVWFPLDIIESAEHIG